MEDKLELIDEVMNIVIELDIDIYFNDEETYNKLCVTNSTSKVSDALFKLKQLIKKDHGNK
jgi:hypothetical protein